MFAYKIVYHLYVIFAEERDKLYNYCIEKGIEAKIHYPIPIHLQPAAKFLNIKEGSFPVVEKQSKQILTLPVNQSLEQADIEKIISTINRFFSN